MPRYDTFDAFATAHLDDLLRLARVMTAQTEEAEDLTQETLFKVYRHWRRLKGIEAQYAYARRMMTNAFLDEKRKRRPSTVSLTEFRADPAAARAIDPADVQAMREAVAALPPRQRVVVILRFYEELEISEVAVNMGIGESSVRSALARALSQLRITSMTSGEIV